MGWFIFRFKSKIIIFDQHNLSFGFDRPSFYYTIKYVGSDCLGHVTITLT